MRHTVYAECDLELGNLGNASPVVGIKGIDEVSVAVMTIQAGTTTGGFPGSTIIQCQVSNDGTHWFSFPTAVEITADGITNPLCVTPYQFFRVAITDASASTDRKAAVAIYGEGFPFGI